MTPEATDIPRRLVAASWWEWREGMAFRVGDDVLRILGTREDTWEGEPITWVMWATVDAGDEWDAADMPPPDLSDPATVGVLLEMCGAFALHIRAGVGWAQVNGHTATTLGEATALAMLEVLGE